jgi:hypothetical protein
MLRRSPGAVQQHRRRRWWCTADPGSRFAAAGIVKVTGVPGLRSTTPQSGVLHRARDTGKSFSEAAMSQTFYVYILASRYRGTLYVGVSNDISRRVGEHKSGIVKAFTQRYKVHRLV